MKLVWSRRATCDLEQIGIFISLDAPERARVFIQSLIERGKQAAQFPNAGRVVPEFQDENVRELIEGNYRIVYEIFSNKTVVILTVFEGHRLIKKPAHR
jgi:toxin ParE1/3/4